MPCLPGFLFEIGGRGREALCALDIKIKAGAGAQVAYESLVAVRLGGADGVVEMGGGDAEAKPLAQRQHREQHRDRIGTSGQSNEDKVVAMNSKAVHRIRNGAKHSVLDARGHR